MKCLSWLSQLSFAIVVSSAFVAHPLVAAEFDELARRLPPNANAVVVVNAATMFASPLAQQEGWQPKFADAFEATPFLLPPSARRCVIAAMLNRNTLRSEWEAAAMELAVDPQIADVAQRRDGKVEQLGAATVAALPGEVWVARFAPNVFGLLTSASRDEAAAWATQAGADAASNLSPYLREAVSYADTAGTDVILALDLGGTLREPEIRAAVAASAVLKNISPDEATRIFAGIRGVKFGVRVTDKMTGRLELDFAEDPAALAPVAKPLVLAIVARVGAMLDEFPQWTAEVEGNSISIAGDLTSEGMRRVFSLLELNSAIVESPAPYEPPTGTVPAAQDAMAKASLRYFKALSKFVEGAGRLGRADSVQQAIMWLENFARRVQNLPTKNVDPELVEYGKYVAQTLQSVVDLAYGVERHLEQADAAAAPENYRIGLLPTANTVNYGGYRTREYVPYGYAQLNPERAQQARQKAEDAIYQANQQASETLTKLAADHETVRKNLTQRYGLKF